MPADSRLSAELDRVLRITEQALQGFIAMPPTGRTAILKGISSTGEEVEVSLSSETVDRICKDHLNLLLQGVRDAKSPSS